MLDKEEAFAVEWVLADRSDLLLLLWKSDEPNEEREELCWCWCADAEDDRAGLARLSAAPEKKEDSRCLCEGPLCSDVELLLPAAGALLVWGGEAEAEAEAPLLRAGGVLGPPKWSSDSTCGACGLGETSDGAADGGNAGKRTTGGLSSTNSWCAMIGAGKVCASRLEWPVLRRQGRLLWSVWFVGRIQDRLAHKSTRSGDSPAAKDHLLSVLAVECVESCCNCCQSFKRAKKKKVKEARTREFLCCCRCLKGRSHHFPALFCT